MIARFFKVGLLVACLCVTPLFAEAASGQIAKAASGKVSRESSGVNEVFKAPGLIAEHKAYAPSGSVLLAQADGDDAYDPFADYSEFEQSMDEEEDVNFFRNGRLLTLGFIGGYRGFTQNLGNYYSGNAGFGLFLAYFFDLNFALQLGYFTSDHTLVIPENSPANAVQGTVSLSEISFLLKYYMNTQNVTRGLAALSPYLVGGFSQIYRTTVVSGDDAFAKDSAFAFNAGAGIEIPMMRNKMYFGVQGLYQVISFADESKIVLDGSGADTPTGAVLSGDGFLVQGILGINF